MLGISIVRDLLISGSHVSWYSSCSVLNREQSGARKASDLSFYCILIRMWIKISRSRSIQLLISSYDIIPIHPDPSRWITCSARLFQDGHPAVGPTCWCQCQRPGGYHSLDLGGGRVAFFWETLIFGLSYLTAIYIYIYHMVQHGIYTVCIWLFLLCWCCYLGCYFWFGLVCLKFVFWWFDGVKTMESWNISVFWTLILVYTTTAHKKHRVWKCQLHRTPGYQLTQSHCGVSKPMVWYFGRTVLWRPTAEALGYVSIVQCLLDALADPWFG